MEEGASTSVMAYNVLYRGADDQATMDLIAREAPDILCLREVSTAFEKKFRERFSSSYPHQSFAARRHGTWGVGIVSRYPIRRWRTFRQRPLRLPAGEAEIFVQGRSTLVVCVHWCPPGTQFQENRSWLYNYERAADTRREQSAHLTRRYRKDVRPIILLGDFNESRTGGGIQRLLKAGFLDRCTDPKAQCRGTWPGATTLWPAIVQIDHILTRGFADAGHATVLRGGGSDHYPIRAQLRAADPAALRRSTGRQP